MLGRSGGFSKRLISPRTHIATHVIPIINLLLSAHDSPSVLWDDEVLLTEDILYHPESHDPKPSNLGLGFRA